MELLYYVCIFVQKIIQKNTRKTGPAKDGGIPRRYRVGVWVCG